MRHMVRGMRRHLLMHLVRRGHVMLTMHHLLVDGMAHVTHVRLHRCVHLRHDAMLIQTGLDVRVAFCHGLVGVVHGWAFGVVEAVFLIRYHGVVAGHAVEDSVDGVDLVLKALFLVCSGANADVGLYSGYAAAVEEGMCLADEAGDIVP